MLEIDAEPWVIKFSDGDRADAPLIEHATLTLARGAFIRTATSIAVRLTDGHAIAVKRFDRSSGQRRHCLSAAVALRAAAEPFGYPELAQLLRRKGVAQGERYVKDMQELFRRMVFNILMDNTDDYEKNHALIVSADQQYELSAAYDVLPTGQALGFQQMRIGHQGADSTLENALSMSNLFVLKPDGVVTDVRRVARVMHGWKAHLRACGVSVTDIEYCRADRSALSARAARRVRVKNRAL